MRAAIQHEPAATPVIVDDFEEPVAGEGEVVITMRTVGLGGQDIVGAYQDGMVYPSVVRAEGVGFDENGRRVYFGERSRLPYGALAERTVVPAEEAWEVPEDISDELAVTMGISGTGAWVPLRDGAHIKEGESVLVMGATGAVGQLGLQLAKHLGAGRVVAAGRDQASLDELVQRGIADAGVAIQSTEEMARAAARHREALDSAYDTGIASADFAQDGDDDVARLRAASGSDGFDMVLDILYGDYFTAAAKATRPGARIVTIGAPAGFVAPVAAFDMVYRYHTSWGTGMAPAAERHQTWLDLLELGRQGIDVSYKRFSFDQSAQAYEAQRSSPRAKVIVTLP